MEASLYQRTDSQKIPPIQPNNKHARSGPANFGSNAIIEPDLRTCKLSLSPITFSIIKKGSRCVRKKVWFPCGTQETSLALMIQELIRELNQPVNQTLMIKESIRKLTQPFHQACSINRLFNQKVNKSINEINHSTLCLAVCAVLCGCETHPEVIHSID